MKLTPFFIPTLLLLASCAPEEAAPPAPNAQEQHEVITTGHAIADTLVRTLGEQLKAALTSGGPEAAVTVCQTAAQPLTSSVASSTPGVRIRRTALKVRNPVNSPDNDDRAVLQQFAALPPDQRPPQIVQWTKDSARFYKPLVMQEVCTKCHGNPDTFSPALRELITQAYPDDQATGYSTGQLRGVIRVDLVRD